MTNDGEYMGSLVPRANDGTHLRPTNMDRKWLDYWQCGANQLRYLQQLGRMKQISVWQVLKTDERRVLNLGKSLF